MPDQSFINSKKTANRLASNPAPNAITMGASKPFLKTAPNPADDTAMLSAMKRRMVKV